MLRSRSRSRSPSKKDKDRSRSRSPLKKDRSGSPPTISYNNNAAAAEAKVRHAILELSIFDMDFYVFQIKTNPFTRMPYSKKYWQIWEKRRQLPVWEYKDKFMEILHNNQCKLLHVIVLLLAMKNFGEVIGNLFVQV